jgi:hypothetical protein
MVNFQNETTIAQKPKNILEIIIIQRWHDLVEAWELLYKNKEGYDQIIPIVQARTKTLLISIISSIRNDETKGLKDYEERVLKVKSTDLLTMSDTMNSSSLFNVFLFISDFLYKKGLLKFDMKPSLHPTDVVKRNDQMDSGEAYEY